MERSSGRRPCDGPPFTGRRQTRGVLLGRLVLVQSGVSAAHGLPGGTPGDRLRRLGLEAIHPRLTVDRDFNHLHDHLDLRAVLPSIRIGLIDKDLEV